MALLDVMMPVKDGLTVAEEIRRKDPHLPIIFLTALSKEDSHVCRGYECGAVDYIVKPINPIVLKSKVKILLDMRRQQSELLEQQRRLKFLNKELESFAYTISHDLRAPLRSIEGFCILLQEEKQSLLDEEGLDYLCRMKKESHRMFQMIEDILTLSRASSSEIREEELDLSEMTREIVESLQRNDPHRDVQIKVQAPLLARGDRGLLQQVMENLLSNAWKFSKGSKDPRIEVGEQLWKGKRVFFVADNGVGFDLEEGQDLTRPFLRLHDCSEFPGSGIGLSTVKRIVERHDGELFFDAKKGEGARFFFSLKHKMGADND